MTTADLERDLTKTVSLGYDRIQRLVLAAESLAEEEAEVDPEFASALRADADSLREVAAAGTLRTDDPDDDPIAVEFSAALDD